MVQVIEKNGIKRKLFYGMSSSTAMKKHKGGVAEYRQENSHISYYQQDCSLKICFV